MRHYRVETVCTTDDPVDSLEHHIATKASGFEIRMLPTWRPDKAMAVEDPEAFRSYVERLEQVSGLTISGFADFIGALEHRHDFFAAQGCRLSDHGFRSFMQKIILRTTSDVYITRYMAASIWTKRNAPVSSRPCWWSLPGWMPKRDGRNNSIMGRYAMLTVG